MSYIKKQNPTTNHSDHPKMPITEDIVKKAIAEHLISQNGVVAQMPVAAEVGSGDERDELGSG